MTQFVFVDFFASLLLHKRLVRSRPDFHKFEPVCHSLLHESLSFVAAPDLALFVLPKTRETKKKGGNFVTSLRMTPYVSFCELDVISKTRQQTNRNEHPIMLRLILYPIAWCCWCTDDDRTSGTGTGSGDYHLLVRDVRCSAVYAESVRYLLAAAVMAGQTIQIRD